MFPRVVSPAHERHGRQGFWWKRRRVESSGFGPRRTRVEQDHELLESFKDLNCQTLCVKLEWQTGMREREMFYLTTHSTHFIYGYMASDIWLRTILIVRKETCCRHIGYSYRLTARVLLYAPSHRQDST